MKEEKKPFFARFLEDMEEEKLDRIKAGSGDTTHKYPSDKDEE